MDTLPCALAQCREDHGCRWRGSWKRGVLETQNTSPRGRTVEADKGLGSKAGGG